MEQFFKGTLVDAVSSVDAGFIFRTSAGEARGQSYVIVAFDHWKGALGVRERTRSRRGVD